jgi:hypothetical protein
MTVNTNKKAVEPKGVPAEQKKNEVLETSTELVIIPREEPRKVTAEDRIEKALNFAILTTRFDQLNSKKKELEKFTLASDGLTGLTLDVRSKTNLSFTISNANVIGELLKCAQVKVNELVAQAENDVLTFEI